MDIYRNISMRFWTDSKVVDNFTPEDRYFYLYLFTNPHTNLCGCYEISIRQMVNEVGYSKDSIMNLLKRFRNVHKVIDYCEATKEVLLINFHKYNWAKTGKCKAMIEKDISKIKTDHFREYLSLLVSTKDDSSIQYRALQMHNIDTVTDTVTDTDSVTVTDIDNNIYMDNIDEYIYINNNINNSENIANCNDHIAKMHKSIAKCNANCNAKHIANIEKDADELIDRLWKLYPRKRGKSAISKKEKPNILKIGYDEMARAIERYKSEVEGKEAQYIMIGSTFFNGRYKDYLDADYEPPQRVAKKTRRAKELEDDYQMINEWAKKSGRS